jgi:hypothetical protein
MGALANVATLLMADERHGLAGEAPDPGHERSVVRERAVAVQLDEVVEDPLDVVERVGPVLVAREFDGVPDLVGARLGGDTVDLMLESGQLARDSDAPQEGQVAKPGEALAQAQLLRGSLPALSRHFRRARGRGRGKA